MTLGACLNMDSLPAFNEVLGGSMTATWETFGGVGTWTVTQGKSQDCPPTAPLPWILSAGTSTLDLPMRGCGRLHVEISGTGCKSFAMPQARVRVRHTLPTSSSFVTVAEGRGPGGGSSPGLCSQDGPMVAAAGFLLEADFRVRCGDVVRFVVDGPLHSQCPGFTVAFTIRPVP